jgi:apolipoprotein N-acyltransferase
MIPFSGKKFSKAILAICAAILSGFMLAASFPVSSHSYLAWVALVPFFLILLLARPIHGCLLSLVFGLFYLPGVFNWMLEVPGYTLLHHYLLGLYFVPYSLAFGSFFILTATHLGASKALLAAPFYWVSIEFIRSNMFFLALPWGLLAHSQYLHPTVIQISSITSAYGLSFLIVLVNSAITAAVLPLVVRQTNCRALAKTPPGRRVLAFMASAGMAVAATLLYGYVAISPPADGEKVRLSVIQPNIEQKKKWNPKFEKYIMQTLTELSFKAAKDRPQLIIWPETATPRAITENYGLFKQVQEISKKTDASLLIGSSERQKHQVKKRSERKYMNSAFLIHPNRSKGKHQRYDKIRLLPFAEYLPYKEKIPWSYAKIPDIKGYVPGEEFIVFKQDNFAFSTTICWENIYPELVRSFVRAGAQFIVNISNEAWFGKTAAPYQFLSMSVFRAVENKIFVVRSGNTGVSCIIDPYGRVVYRVRDNGGQDLFVPGFLTGSITLYGLESFYTKFGDIFVYISLAVSACLLIFSLFKFQNKNRKPSRNE